MTARPLCVFVCVCASVCVCICVHTCVFLPSVLIAWTLPSLLCGGYPTLTWEVQRQRVRKCTNKMIAWTYYNAEGTLFNSL